MKRLDVYAHTKKQRCLLMLLPLMILAISTWSLDKSILTSLSEAQREYFLILSRIVCLGGFAFAVAYMVPTFNRLLQMLTVLIVYVTLLAAMAHYNIDVLRNPVSCVIATLTSLFALLPHYDFAYHPEKILRQRFISFCFALCLPCIAIIFIIIIINQIDLFITHTFDEMFGRSLLSAVYVPLFLMLQVVGFQCQIGDLVALHYDQLMVTAFVNAIMVTHFISLPALLFVRAFYAHKHLLLFVYLLTSIAILTNSLGSCASLILMLLIIFFPGSFVILLLNSVVCFFASLYLQMPAITPVTNLYAPDINEADVIISFYQQYGIFNTIALFFPITLLIFSILAHREHSVERKRRLKLLSIGYRAHQDSPLELYFIAFLRATGGLKNLSAVKEIAPGRIYLWVHDPHDVSLAALNSLVKEKAILHRFDKMYECNVGKEKSGIVVQRLSRMLANQFGEEKEEFSVTGSAALRALAFVGTNTSVRV